VLQRALEVDQQSGSEEVVATSIKNLAYAHWNLNDYDIAQWHLQNALACFEKTQGLQGSDVTNIKTDLAELAQLICFSAIATSTLETSATSARGLGAKRVEKQDDDEEEKRQGELRRAQEQLKKCLEDADYMAAAAVKEKNSALMSAEPKPVEKEEEQEEGEMLQAELRRARDQPKKEVEEEDYTGAST